MSNPSAGLSYANNSGRYNTADSCGLPRTDLFGDVCAFVARGATCNAFTNQCEF